MSLKDYTTQKEVIWANTEEERRLLHDLFELDSHMKAAGTYGGNLARKDIWHNQICYSVYNCSHCPKDYWEKKGFTVIRANDFVHYYNKKIKFEKREEKDIVSHNFKVGNLLTFKSNPYSAIFLVIPDNQAVLVKGTSLSNTIGALVNLNTITVPGFEKITDVAITISPIIDN